MRDPQRIEHVLLRLRQVWEHRPDLRLGQILILAIRPTDPCTQVFSAEDEAVLRGLDRLLMSLSEE